MSNDLVADQPVCSAPVYPAYTYFASPTYNKWVKLTAVDVHALRQEPGFESQNIYFHLNHPIRFVYVLGIIVAVDFVHTNFTIITIDDGSGALIEAKITHLIPPKNTDSLNQQRFSDAGRQQLCSKGIRHAVEKVDRLDKRQLQQQDASYPQLSNGQSHASQPYPTTMETVVPNLTVTTGIGLSIVRLCGSALDVGTRLKVKGTLYRYRKALQLTVLTAFRVKGANEEARVWKEYAAFCTNVLARTWVLSARQLARLEEEERTRHAKERARLEHEAESQRTRRRRRQALQHRRERHEQKAERKRLEEAKELDGNPLDRPCKSVTVKSNEV